MGVRMGSTVQLAKMGVAAIPTEEGVRRFLDLVAHDPGATQVVVTARIGGLDTWRPPRPALPPAARYLEEIVSVEPGVETVARARLTLERDDYVRDHVWKGSPLLPTVFGLEAMAQAAAHVTGIHELDRVTIRDVRLERPIVVDPEHGIEIELRAEVVEREAASDAFRVRVSIATAQTQFARAHFSAELELGGASDSPVEPLDAPATTLAIDPERDLYSWLLFQGPRFHRIRALHSLDSEHCQFVADAESQEERYVLGDPFFRDALLQAGQLLVPQQLCLPVRIDRIELYPARAAAGSRVALAFDKREEDGHIDVRVVAVDAGGRVVERLEGYRSRILERRDDHPTAEEIADPAARDAALLRRELAEAAQRFGVQAPELSLAYLPGLHALTREKRREAELPLFEEAVARVLAGGGGKS
jgi:enediyne polyketide synthase